MSWTVIGLAYDIAKYVEFINTVSHYADTKNQLKEATTLIETLKNDLNGKIYERRLIFWKPILIDQLFIVVKQDVQSSKSKIDDLTTELTSKPIPV